MDIFRRNFIRATSSALALGLSRNWWRNTLNTNELSKYRLYSLRTG